MRRWIIAVVLAVIATGATSAWAQPAEGPPPPPSAEEMQPFRPSGFWTSPHPAKGGAYRYRMLGIGVGLIAITGFFTVRALRRANAHRAKQHKGSPS